MTDMKHQLHHGDCLEVLKTMAANSVDSIVTDPPYGLSFMGKKWDYDVPSVEIWAECLRVLKPGGHLLAFAGTRTQHRMAVRIEDAGFEIRDMIAWVYGSGFPKSHNLKDNWQGWGTALKPALEPITVARKPLGEKTVAANVLEHGTGAINVDGCRIPSNDKTPAPVGNYVGSEIGPTGLRGERDGSADHQGRWPANLIHDGSDEVVGLFPQTTSGKPMKRMHTDPGRSVASGAGLGGGGEYFHDGYGDTGSAARFFYCAKASKKDRDEGCEGMEERMVTRYGSMGQGPIPQQTPSVPVPQRNHHPTVKPTDLMRYLCRLVTQPGGVVLDPFMGSGSTGKAAVLEEFQFIGIERDAEYLEIAKARIARKTSQQTFL